MTESEFNQAVQEYVAATTAELEAQIAATKAETARLKQQNDEDALRAMSASDTVN